MNAYQYAREQMNLEAPEFGYQNCSINDFLGNRSNELKDIVCVSKKKKQYPDSLEDLHALIFPLPGKQGKRWR